MIRSQFDLSIFDNGISNVLLLTYIFFEKSFVNHKFWSWLIWMMIVMWIPISLLYFVSLIISPMKYCCDVPIKDVVNDRYE